MAKIRSGFVSNSSSSSFVILPISSDKFIEKYEDSILECIREQDIYDLNLSDDEDIYDEKYNGELLKRFKKDYEVFLSDGYAADDEVFTVLECIDITDITLVSIDVDSSSGQVVVADINDIKEKIKNYGNNL